VTGDFTPDDIETARRLFAGPCDFIWGAASAYDLPPPDRAEMAFAGRSNVGKSSLINALTGRQTLARTSDTPGRTQQLNYFNLGGAINMVDMPGYGYAKVSKQQRQDWDDLIFTYLRGRATLRIVLVLVDSRHGLKDVDSHIMDLLDRAGVNYRIVFTKVDKTSPAALKDMTEKTKSALKKHPAAYPEILMTSSETGAGIETLRAVINAIR
jgi:GTP-binding protein